MPSLSAWSDTILAARFHFAWRRKSGQGCCVACYRNGGKPHSRRPSLLVLRIGTKELNYRSLDGCELSWSDYSGCGAEASFRDSTMPRGWSKHQRKRTTE